jgi:hypothetical protein
MNAMEPCRSMRCAALHSSSSGCIKSERKHAAHAHMYAAANKKKYALIHMMVLICAFMFICAVSLHDFLGSKLTFSAAMMPTAATQLCSPASTASPTHVLNTVDADVSPYTQQFIQAIQEQHCEQDHCCDAYSQLA